MNRRISASQIAGHMKRVAEPGAFTSTKVAHYAPRCATASGRRPRVERLVETGKVELRLPWETVTDGERGTLDLGSAPGSEGASSERSNGRARREGALVTQG